MTDRKPGKRGLALLAAVLMTALAFTGCGSGKGTESTGSAASSTATTTGTAEKAAVNVFAIKGPTGVGMVNLMAENDAKTTVNSYNFQVVSSPEEVVAKISNGEADIAAVPTNLASTLYKKTSGKVQMLAVNTLGVLYIMENGDTIQSVADLRGKTIYSTGKGANPEYVLRYILEKNGIDPDKDVTLEFRSENDELATLLASGEAKVALVPEPVVTTVKTKNADLRTALNMTEEWDKAAGGESKLMMGCVIARKEFIDQNPDAVKAFLTEYKASIEKTAADIGGSASLCEQYGIIPKAAIAKAAIPGCNLTYVDGDAMMEQIKGYFDVLFAANPQSIGGALPDDAFYYNASK